MEDLRYPVGKFRSPSSPTFDDVRKAIDEIAAFPKALRAAVAGLNDTQLDTRYREGGWTVRQVVHHVPDSHMNAYTRMKLTVTEDNPRIKTYQEALWAELHDSRTAPIDLSLSLIDALHDRWVRFMRSLPESAFKRPLHHPESGDVKLEWLVLMYGWHGRHHTAHITSLRERKGWK